MKRLKNYFRNMKMAGKMSMVYFSFAGAFLLIAMIALQVSFHVYDEKLYEKSLQELDFFSQSVNENLERINELSGNMALENDIQELLTEMGDMEYLSAQYSYSLNKLRRLIQDELYSYPVVKNVIYTDGKEVMLKVGTDTGELRDGTAEELLDAFHEARGGYVTRNPGADYPYLLSGRDILEVKNATLDYMGSLILTSDITGIIEAENDNLAAEHAALFIYSQDGMIYQGEEMDVTLPEFDRNMGYEIIRYQGQKYFMCYLISKPTGWMYVNLFPYTEIYGYTMKVRYWMLGGFLILFLILQGAMRRMSVVLTRPLGELTESMKIVEKGAFQEAKNTLNPSPSRDEVGELTREFGVMLDQIDHLIYENYEKQLILKDTSYKMLQAQINPHFLYNTLNTLNWLVRGNQKEDAGKMIMELGRILRASFAKEPYTTVADEVENARGYITIQQYRYRSRADFVIETDGELEQYRIPRMILQPLIENAILYGVDNTLSKCTVTVRVKEEEEEILLEVKDTGRGMTEEQLQAARAGTITPKGHGIGLKNIRERLKIAFEDSTLEIGSQWGSGTKISIRIPKIRMEGQHV